MVKPLAWQLLMRYSPATNSLHSFAPSDLSSPTGTTTTFPGWGSWCASYSGIYGILTRFDQAYGGANPAPANLASKWATFNRRELDNIARIGRDYVDLLYSLKKPVGGLWGYWWDLKWYTVMRAPLLNQRSYIQFSKTCPNLP